MQAFDACGGEDGGEVIAVVGIVGRGCGEGEGGGARASFDEEEVDELSVELFEFGGGLIFGDLAELYELGEREFGEDEEVFVEGGFEGVEEGSFWFGEEGGDGGI